MQLTVIHLCGSGQTTLHNVKHIDCHILFKLVLQCTCDTAKVWAGHMTYSQSHPKELSCAQYPPISDLHTPDLQSGSNPLLKPSHSHHHTCRAPAPKRQDLQEGLEMWNLILYSESIASAGVAVSYISCSTLFSTHGWEWQSSSTLFRDGSGRVLVLY